MEVENLNPTLQNKDLLAPELVLFSAKALKPYMFPPGTLKLLETRARYQEA
jgi:hypothetical protein